MPTSKPRLALTLSPHVAETLNRMATLTGKSRGAFVVELLEAIHPSLMRTVALMEAARDAPHEVRAGLVQTVEDLERDLRGQQGAALRQLDWLGVEFVRAGAAPHILTGGAGTKDQGVTSEPEGPESGELRGQSGGGKRG